jgi:TonB family protein
MLPEKVYQSVLPDRLPDIVWIAQPGPGGGGGGGGNKSPDPPKKAEIKAEKPVVETPKPEVKKEPDPPLETKIPAETPAPVVAPGVLESTQAANESQGKGELDGGGSGKGTGVGPGEGSGLGPGRGGGVGGGTYRPGNGVTIPQLVREVKPAYTADAMRAKVQGTVWLECVVMPDGTVGKVEVVRSLDSTFGLDQEAIKAAKQWRFRPGTRLGEPVPVLITIELAFTLR